MFDMIWSNLWHRKARTILTIMGVGMAVMLYVYMSQIMEWYDSNIQHTVSSFAGKVIVQQKTDGATPFPPTGSFITNADAQVLLGRADIDPERSSAVLFEPLVPSIVPNMPPTVTAVGITPGREFAFIGNSSVEGKAVLAAHEVVLGSRAAEYYTVHVGDVLNLKDAQFTVAGVLDPANELYNSMVLMPLDEAQAMFLRQGIVSVLLLTSRNADLTTAVASAIETEFRGLSATTSESMLRNAQELLQTQRAFFTSLRGMMLTVSLFMVVIVMVIAVAERRKEIGTLKALGASNNKMLMLIVIEAVILTLAGGLVGLLDVHIYAWIRNEGLEIAPNLAIQTLGFTVLIGVLAAIWPARSAMRVNPVESLRYE